MTGGLLDMIKKYYKGLSTIRKYLDNIRKKPDVIIIGENHGDPEHPYICAKLIKENEPEYVLHEGFNKYNISIFSNKKQEIGLSLKELCEKYGVSLEEVGFTREALNIKKLEEILSESMNYIEPENPDRGQYLCYTAADLKYLPTYAGTYEDFIKKPVVTFHPAILDYLLKIIEKKSEEKLSTSGRHYSEDLLSLHYISSVLKRAKLVSEIFRECLGSNLPRFYIILSAVYEVGAKIEECDSEYAKNILIEKHRLYLEKSDEMRSEVVEMSSNLLELLKKSLEGNLEDFNLEKFEKLCNDISTKSKELDKLNEDLYKCQYEINGLREMAMANSIEECVKNRQTDAPIIAIMGKNHVKNVAKLLKKRGIKCKVIKLRDSIKDQELKEDIARKYIINMCYT